MNYGMNHFVRLFTKRSRILLTTQDMPLIEAEAFAVACIKCHYETIGLDRVAICEAKGGRIAKQFDKESFQ